MASPGTDQLGKATEKLSVAGCSHCPLSGTFCAQPATLGSVSRRIGQPEGHAVPALEGVCPLPGCPFHHMMAFLMLVPVAATGSCVSGHLGKAGRRLAPSYPVTLTSFPGVLAVALGRDFPRAAHVSLPKCLCAPLRSLARPAALGQPDRVFLVSPRGWFMWGRGALPWRFSCVFQLSGLRLCWPGTRRPRNTFLWLWYLWAQTERTLCFYFHG